MIHFLHPTFIILFSFFGHFWGVMVGGIIMEHRGAIVKK